MRPHLVMLIPQGYQDSELKDGSGLVHPPSWARRQAVNPLSCISETNENKAGSFIPRAAKRGSVHRRMGLDDGRGRAIMRVRGRYATETVRARNFPPTHRPRPLAGGQPRLTSLS